MNVYCGTRGDLGENKTHGGRGAAVTIQWSTGKIGSHEMQGIQHGNHSCCLESHDTCLQFLNPMSKCPTHLSHPGFFVPSVASPETQKKIFNVIFLASADRPGLVLLTA